MQKMLSARKTQDDTANSNEQVQAAKIQPIPGLQLNIDGSFGVVKPSAADACLVDFNHPLAGKDLVYDVKINKIGRDDKEK